MKNNSNNTKETGLMTEKEFNHAVASIKMNESVSKACYLILVSGYYKTVACKLEAVSRPTVNKYIDSIKIEWRKNIANS